MLGGHVNSSPSIRSDNVVIVGSHDHRLYAFAPDGTALWAFGTKNKIQGCAAILAYDEVVFGGDDGFVYRLNTKGGIKWKANLKGPILGGIAVSKDERTLFVGAMTGEISAIHAASGKILWSVHTGGPIRATPILDSEGLLYVGSRDGHIYSIDAVDGRILWSKDLGAQIDSSVAVASGNRLVVATDDGAVYFLGEKNL